MSAPAPTVETILRDRIAGAHNARTGELQREADLAARRLADRLAAVATFRLVLEGDGGGEWYLVLRNGTMRVETAADEAPVVTVFQTLEGWWRLVAADQAFLGAGGGPELTPARVARLRALAGALEFRLTDVDEGKPVSVLVQLGEARDRLAPTTTLTLRAADAGRIRRGDLNPQQAMMQGLVQLTGDPSLAIQVGLALFT